MNPNLDDRWDQLLEAVSKEFLRHDQDPNAVFEPNRDLLELRARIDRLDGPEWLSIPLTEGQILNGHLAGIASRFVANYRAERDSPPNSDNG
jgi:hypothetical protein